LSFADFVYPSSFATDRPIDEVLAEIRETFQRYNYVLQEVVQKRQRLTIKEPEIRKCLDSVNLLIEQREAGAESVSGTRLFNLPVKNN
jgi:hypothetical protein